MRYPDGGGLTAKARTKREAARREAAVLLGQGLPVAEVASRLRVSAEIVYRWRRAIGEGGVEALASKGSSGASCRLDDDQLRRLADELDRGPVAHGFGPDQRWTLARITELVDRLFGVRYTLRGTSYLLHRMGFSPQVSARRAAERDPAQIEDWHTRRWPSVRG
ncbi:winged helix-turn-helix domain-containing protein [Dactylosporangium siamense]|nr:winged helix-turn-helix domain-containing protein [Dactylosporangium siamense]